MRAHWAKSHRATSPLHSPSAAPFLLSLLLLAASTASQLRGQTTPQPTPPEQPGYTLHVYTNLVQIPALVLDPSLSALPPLSKDEFNISLDSGPRFHPTHMRTEGDDPIDLAILLDVSDDGYYLQPALSHSISAFVAHSLLPHDHVSIYVIDCLFIPAAKDIPATNVTQVVHALDTAIDHPKLHGTKTSPHCGRSIHLWDALMYISESVANAPGRRIILAISPGQDHHSKVKWNELRRYADFKSITIFGMYPAIPIASKGFQLQLLDDENPFNELCQLTGGLVLFTTPPDVSKNLKHIIDLARGRYILEFPRPDKGIPGMHIIDVTLTKTDAFIRTAGITFPLRDPTLLSDPTTVQSTPSPAIYGTRHPLDPH